MEDHSHKRYYLFQHRNGENILYLDFKGEWGESFEDAKLFSSEEETVCLAETYAKYWTSPENTFFVVGCVRVDVDPLYAMIAKKCN
jgi:hypothetical protein